MTQRTLVQTHLLDTWKRCRGYYKTPETDNGLLVGPIVAYTATYKDGGTDKRYVGTEYYDFAMVEEHHQAVDEFAAAAYGNFCELKLDCRPDVVIAAPMGGIVFGHALTRRRLDIRFGFAEKRSSKSGGTGEELILGRHRVTMGEKVVLVEDVANNFATTGKLVQLVEDAGGEVLALICALNRSERGLKAWINPKTGLGFPVVSALFRPTPQYRQDDPKVAGAIAEGEVLWDPKVEWHKLSAAMSLAKP